MQLRTSLDQTFASFRNALDGIKQLMVGSTLRKAVADRLHDCTDESARVGRSMGRFFASGVQSAVLLNFGALLLFCTSTLAQDKPLVREIFIPFDDLNVILEADVHRVFLSRPQYEELIAKAKVKTAETAPLAATFYQGVSGDGELALDEPAAAVAPGQAAVMYDGDRVLGGGWIRRRSEMRSPPAAA